MPTLQQKKHLPARRNAFEGDVHSEYHSEYAMLQRTLIMLGAVTVAGFAVLGFGRQLDRWRRSNLDFDYPLEELFI